MQWGVSAGDSDGSDFKLLGWAQDIFVPFFVATEECVEFVAFYGFFASMLRWLGSDPGRETGVEV